MTTATIVPLTGRMLRGRAASERLTRALVDLAAQRLRPPRSDHPSTHLYWLSEGAGECAAG
jgi:hypothetical protein